MLPLPLIVLPLGGVIVIVFPLEPVPLLVVVLPPPIVKDGTPLPLLDALPPPPIVSCGVVVSPPAVEFPAP